MAACVRPPCPGLWQSRGRGHWQPRVLPGPTCPGEPCPARACVRERAREHVCTGRPSPGTRSVQLQRTSHVRAGLGHQPGLWLRLAGSRGVWRTPLPAAPSLPSTERRGEGLCSRLRGPCPGPWPGRAGCAQGSAPAVLPSPRLCSPARQRAGSAPCWRWGAGQPAALPAALSAGAAARRCPVDRPCLLENVGPTPQAGALGWCGTDLGSCLQRVLPAGRVRRGTGQPGLWQHAGAQAERGTMAVTTSAASLANAGCWSWAGAAGLGRAGPGRGLQAETPPVSPACRCPSLQHPKQQRRAERGRVGPGARPSQPRRPQALSPVLSLRR